MRKINALMWTLCCAITATATELPLKQKQHSTEPDSRNQVAVGMLMPAREGGYQNYPGALADLLEAARRETLLNLRTQPVTVRDFNDPKIRTLPLIYLNFLERKNWKLNPDEQEKLKSYLLNGGMLFVDAGVAAEFLRKNRMATQHHSFAEWQPHPELKRLCENMFPQQQFKPLNRKSKLFKIFFQGLPDCSKLPPKVRDYTVNEKWPDGSYSVLVLELNGQPAVLATPIIAMGWGVNQLGQWNTNIHFRILQHQDGMTEYLNNAAYRGEKFQVVREDGAKNTIYCQEPTKPAWCREPDGKIRMFTYLGSPEINQVAHQFYTRLGINIIIYALVR